jgi:prepilin-type N-terminal cleavage/methylation domain-containing protein
MEKKLRDNGGFTLIELIIVIIILGILAALAIPQFTPATEDAQVATMDGNLKVVRTAIELYYHQHSSTYPGYNDYTDGTQATAAEMEPSFIAQLTEYSNRGGVTSTTKNAGTHPFGPYLVSRAIPRNPLPDAATVVADEADIECDADLDALTATVGATKGWRFSVETGEFIANNTTYETH